MKIGALVCLLAAFAFGEGEPASGGREDVLVRLVLGSRGVAHRVLRDDLFTLGDAARLELKLRIETSKDARERWRCEVLLALAKKPEEVRRLEAAWGEAVAAVVCPERFPTYAGMSGGARPDPKKLPKSPLWSAVLGDIAASGWGGSTRFLEFGSGRGRWIEAHRFHALLAVAAAGEKRAASLLGGIVIDDSVRGEQRAAAARALARLDPDGADAWLTGTPVASWAKGGADPAFAPFLLRGVTHRGSGSARDSWAMGNALEAVCRAHAKEFDATLARVAKVEYTYEAEGPDARHHSGTKRGGAWAARKGKDASGHVLYGPYIDDLPTGRHLARFRVKCSGFDPSHRQLQLDVAHQAGRKIVASRSVGGWDLENGRWLDFFLGFASSGEGRTEFRVFWDGGCDVEIDSVTIYSVPDVSGKVASSWTPPNPSDGPATARVAAAEYLFDRAASATHEDYASFRAALARLGSAAIETLRSVPKDDPQRWSAELLAARLASPEAWKQAGAEFVSALEAASTSIEGYRTVMGATVDWSIAAEAWRSVTIEGEAGALPPAQPADDEAGWAEVFTPWQAKCRLPASPLWRHVLAEIALHGWPPEPPGRYLPHCDAVADPNRFHALLHTARLGETRAWPLLMAIAKDPDEPPGLRGAAVATLACVWPAEADAHLTRFAGSEAPKEVRRRTADWIGQLGLVEGRPYLWRLLARDPDYREGQEVLGGLRATDRRPGADAVDAACLIEVATTSGDGAKAEVYPGGRAGNLKFTWKGSTAPPMDEPLVVRLHLTWTGTLPREPGGSISDEVGKTSLGRLGLRAVRADHDARKMELVGLLPVRKHRSLFIHIGWSAEMDAPPPDPTPVLTVERVDVFRVRKL
jgi:hypothetical protein